MNGEGLITGLGRRDTTGSYISTHCVPQVLRYRNTFITLQETLPMTMPGSNSSHFIDAAG